MQLAKKYVVTSGSSYREVFEKIIHPKFNCTDNLFVDASQAYGEIIGAYFSGIKKTPNPDQILEAEKCSFVELDQVNRYLAPEQFWLNDKGCEFEDNYNSAGNEISNEFPNAVVEERNRWDIIIKLSEQPTNSVVARKKPSMGRLMRSEIIESRNRCRDLKTRKTAPL